MPNRLSLLEELGIDEESLSWRHLAMCKGMDLRLFFEGYEEDEELAKAMDEVCLSCPVMKDCLLAGIEDKDYGLHGGIYLDNGKRDKQHNKHKTAKVDARIQERLSE